MIAAQELEAQSRLVDDIAARRRDPLRFVKYVYPWGEGELADYVGPRAWQTKVLEGIRDHLQNPATRFQPLIVVVSSGHGIGKGACAAWVTHWAMSTCEDCKGVITATTEKQLRTKTWSEVAKWFRLAINSHWFTVETTRVSVREDGHELTWRTDAVPWSEEKTEAFAGLHNKGRRILVVFDEGSAISDKIYEVTEGALTDENTEIIWLVFGNPTQTTGRFREFFGKFKHRALTFQIDARTVEGTNKQQLNKWVEDYGEDSDFVRVRVRGEFPRAGSNQFIASDIVEMCRKYKAEGFAHLPKILSVDVARFGDDMTVIGTRQGRKLRVLSKLRGLDTVQVAERVIEQMKLEEPDALVIDGDGLGAGAIDTIKHRGFGAKLHEFHGGEQARDVNQYFNRRAEVWGALRDALKAGMEIPDDPELAQDLTAPQYGFSNKSQIQLEKKEDMKARGLSSPDLGDMAAMTYAIEIKVPVVEHKVEYKYPGEMNQSWMA